MNIPEYNGRGVYGLHNMTRDIWYIGESKRVRSRVRSHLNTLKRGEHINDRIQRDFDRGDVFQVVVLEMLPDATQHYTFLRETAYINAFNAVHNGYNREYPVYFPERAYPWAERAVVEE